MKRNGKTISKFHRRIIYNSQLPLNINEPETSLSVSMDIIRRFKNHDTTVLDEMKSLLMLPIQAIFHNFPMMGLLPSWIYFRNFKFEPLNTLSFGISRMPKKYVIRTLSDIYHCSTSILTASGKSL